MLITREIARKIGANEALKFVSVGLGVAYLIMALLAGPLFFIAMSDFDLNFICAIIVIYLCGYVYGQRAGLSILIKRRNYALIGFLYSFLTLITATFLASWVGFFQQIHNHPGESDNSFNDYIYKPVFLVMLFGLIPVIGVGIWFGRSILKKGIKISEAMPLETT
jgi:hypothetical protein